MKPKQLPPIEIIEFDKDEQLCELQNNLLKYLYRLDRVPEAGELANNTPRCLPVELQPMIF